MPPVGRVDQHEVRPKTGGDPAAARGGGGQGARRRRCTHPALPPATARPPCTQACRRPAGSLRTHSPGWSPWRAPIAAPVSLSARPGALGAREERGDGGRTATTSLAASRATPPGPVASRWSIDRAPIPPASAAAPPPPGRRGGGAPGRLPGTRAGTGAPARRRGPPLDEPPPPPPPPRLRQHLRDRPVDATARHPDARAQPHGRPARLATPPAARTASSCASRSRGRARSRSSPRTSSCRARASRRGDARRSRRSPSRLQHGWRASSRGSRRPPPGGPCPLAPLGARTRWPRRRRTPGAAPSSTSPGIARAATVDLLDVAVERRQVARRPERLDRAVPIGEHPRSLYVAEGSAGAARRAGRRCDLGEIPPAKSAHPLARPGATVVTR